MFTDHAAIFLRKFTDKIFYILFDRDPHVIPSEPEFFLRFLPGDELALRISLVEVPFQHPLLVLSDEISYGIAKGLSRSFYI